MSLGNKLFVLVLLLILLVSGAGIFYLNECLNELDALRPDPQKSYEIREGMTERQVVTELSQRRFHPQIVALWTRLHPEYSHIQQGKYSIDGTKTLSELLELMVRGEVIRIKPAQIAVIPGQIVGRLREKLKTFKEVTEETLKPLNDPATFMEQHLSKAQIEALGGLHDSLEGLLMPDTYPVHKPGEDPLAPVREALARLADFMRAEWPKRAENLPYKDPYEAIIMASLVERESSLDDELPLIAGVFCNRLQKKMRLQTDPAVMYGVDPAFRGPLRRSQLKADTPYNTYTRDGLTPTPIATPSVGALRAALHPADTRALYFVARDVDPKLGHVFSDDLKGHNQAVAEYRKKLKEYREAQKKAAEEAKKAEQKGLDQAVDAVRKEGKDTGSGRGSASPEQGQ